jgi:hypothetical protein
MALISKMLGKNRDMPFVTTVVIPGVAAPNTNDYEIPILSVPNLAALTPVTAGSAGIGPMNAVAIRAIYLMTQSTITGAATNFFTFNVQVRRNLGVNTSTSTTIASGSSVVTPASGSLMNNIQVGTRLDIGAPGTPETVAVTAVTATTFTATFAGAHTFVATAIPIVNSVATPFMALPVNTVTVTTAITATTMAVPLVSMSNVVPGMSLNIAAGGGTAETVVVQSVTATTFTATFTSTHTTGTVVTSTPLATITYSATTVISQAMNAVLFNPVQINNIVMPGDVVTINRNANNATGLITPQVAWELELVPARIR